MPKKSRLSRKEFSALSHARAKRLHGELFSLSVTPLASGRSTAAACVVSKKVSPRATARNRIKRLCREVARKCVRATRSPVALVFIAKKAASEATSAQLRSDAERLLARAGF